MELGRRSRRRVAPRVSRLMSAQLPTLGENVGQSLLMSVGSTMLGETVGHLDVGDVTRLEGASQAWASLGLDISYLASVREDTGRSSTCVMVSGETCYSLWNTSGAELAIQLSRDRHRGVHRPQG